jgi:RecA-family ATPase
MSDIAYAGLQRALEITLQMLAAAADGQWQQVVELDAERQPCIRQQRHDPRSRELLTTLHQHNEDLLKRADAARDMLESELSRHKYNHHALSVYIASSG